MPSEILNRLENEDYLYIKEILDDNLTTDRDIISLLLASDNYKCSYNYLIHFSSNYDVYLINHIISSNDSFLIYKTAKKVNKKYLEILANALINLKDYKYITNFARHIKFAPISLLSKAIIESNNAKVIYNYARNGINYPEDDITEAIIKTEMINYISDYLIFINNLNETNQMLLLNYIVYSKNIDYLLNKLLKKRMYNKFFNYLNYFFKYMDKKKVINILNNLDFEELSDDEKIEYIKFIYSKNLINYLDNLQTTKKRIK